MNGRLHGCGGECNADMLYKQTLYNMRANEHVGSSHYNTVAVMNDFALLMCNVEVYGSKKVEDAEKLFGECIEILDNLIADGMKNIDIMRPLDSDVVIVKNNLACFMSYKVNFKMHSHFIALVQSYWRKCWDLTIRYPSSLEIIWQRCL